MKKKPMDNYCAVSDIESSSMSHSYEHIDLFDFLELHSIFNTEFENCQLMLQSKLNHLIKRYSVKIAKIGTILWLTPSSHFKKKSLSTHQNHLLRMFYVPIQMNYESRESRMKGRVSYELFFQSSLPLIMFVVATRALAALSGGAANESL